MVKTGVWFDALTNYLTAVGFPDDTTTFEHFWPANAHVIGKDVMRFHCLYWPAMLMSAGLKLPKQIAVHGFLTLEGTKISKSRGNIVHPIELVDEFGADAIRYYLLQNLSFASDRDFTREGLIQPSGSSGELEKGLQKVATEVREQAESAFETWEIGNALQSIWKFVRCTNQYLEQSKPWILARESEKEVQLNTVLYTAAEAVRLLAIYLAPFLPNTSDRIMVQLGLGPVKPGAWVNEAGWGSVLLKSVVEGPLLFPRIEAV